MHKTVKSRWGDCTYFKKDEYVGKSIHNYGEYGPDETEKVLDLAIKGKLCLDIGANIGVIAMALKHEGFDVVAFEPQPEVFKLLKKNVGDNVHNVALGDAPGMAPMPKVYYSDKGNFGGLGIGTKSIYGDYQVPVATLDSFGFTNVGFIKMDVEGYEKMVLVGGRETILREKPIMYIEDDRAEKSVALQAYIRELGYTIESHKPMLYRENNFFGLKKNVWAPYNFASHNLICMPC